jgi:hypothetical protein
LDYLVGLSTDEQLCYNMKMAVILLNLRFLVDEAEKFFDKMIIELEQVCINQVIETFISGSISSQLTKKSILNILYKHTGTQLR